MHQVNEGLENYLKKRKFKKQFYAIMMWKKKFQFEFLEADNLLIWLD